MASKESPVSGGGVAPCQYAVSCCVAVVVFIADWHGIKRPVLGVNLVYCIEIVESLHESAASSFVSQRRGGVGAVYDEFLISTGHALGIVVCGTTEEPEVYGCSLRWRCGGKKALPAFSQQCIEHHHDTVFTHSMVPCTKIKPAGDADFSGRAAFRHLLVYTSLRSMATAVGIGHFSQRNP